MARAGSSFRERHPGLVWSSPDADVATLIRVALLHPRFHTLLEACLEFGLGRVVREWETVRERAPEEAGRVRGEVDRMLRHIAEGFGDAQG